MKKISKKAFNLFAILGTTAAIATPIGLGINEATKDDKFNSYEGNLIDHVSKIQTDNGVKLPEVVNAYFDFGTKTVGIDALGEWKAAILAKKSKAELKVISKKIDDQFEEVRQKEGVNPTVVIGTKIMVIGNDYFDQFGWETTLGFYNWFLNDISWGPELATLRRFTIARGISKDGSMITLGGHSGTRENTKITFYPDSFFGAQPIYDGTASSVLVDTSNLDIKANKAVINDYVEPFIKTLHDNKQNLFSANFEQNDVVKNDILTKNTIEKYIEIYDEKTITALSALTPIEGSTADKEKFIAEGNFATLSSFLTYIHGQTEVLAKDTIKETDGTIRTVYPMKYLRRVLSVMYGTTSYTALEKQDSVRHAISASSNSEYKYYNEDGKHAFSTMINTPSDKAYELTSDGKTYLPINAGDADIWQYKYKWILSNDKIFDFGTGDDTPATGHSIQGISGEGYNYKSQGPAIFNVFNNFNSQLPASQATFIGKIIKRETKMSAERVITGSEKSYDGNLKVSILFEKYENLISTMQDYKAEHKWAPVKFTNGKPNLNEFVPNIYLYKYQKREHGFLDYVLTNNHIFDADEIATAKYVQPLIDKEMADLEKDKGLHYGDQGYDINIDGGYEDLKVIWGDITGKTGEKLPIGIEKPLVDKFLLYEAQTKTHLKDFGYVWLKYVASHEYGHHQTLTYAKDIGTSHLPAKPVYNGIYHTDGDQIYSGATQGEHGYEDTYSRTYENAYLRARGGMITDPENPGKLPETDTPIMQINPDAGKTDPYWVFLLNNGLVNRFTSDEDRATEPLSTYKDGLIKLFDPADAAQKDIIDKINAATSKADAKAAALATTDDLIHGRVSRYDNQPVEKSVDQYSDFLKSWRGFKNPEQMLKGLQIDPAELYKIRLKNQGESDVAYLAYLLNSLDETSYSLNPTLQAPEAPFADGTNRIIDPNTGDPLESSKVSPINVFNGWTGTFGTDSSISADTSSVETPYTTHVIEDGDVAGEALKDKMVPGGSGHAKYADYQYPVPASALHTMMTSVGDLTEDTLANLQARFTDAKLQLPGAVGEPFAQAPLFGEETKRITAKFAGDIRIASDLFVKMKVDYSAGEPKYYVWNDSNAPATATLENVLATSSIFDTLPIVGLVRVSILDTVKDAYKEQTGKDFLATDKAKGLTDDQNDERYNFFMQTLVTEMNKDSGRKISGDIPLQQLAAGKEAYIDWFAKGFGMKGIADSQNAVFKKQYGDYLFQTYFKNYGRFLDYVKDYANSPKGTNPIAPTAYLVTMMGSSGQKSGKLNGVYASFLSQGSYTFFPQDMADYQNSLPETINRDLQQLAYAPDTGALQDGVSSEAYSGKSFTMPPVYTSLYNQGGTVTSLEGMGSYEALSKTMTYGSLQSGYYEDLALRRELDGSLYILDENELEKYYRLQIKAQEYATANPVTDKQIENEQARVDALTPVATDITVDGKTSINSWMPLTSEIAKTYGITMTLSDDFTYKYKATGKTITIQVSPRTSVVIASLTKGTKVRIDLLIDADGKPLDHLHTLATADGTTTDITNPDDWAKALDAYGHPLTNTGKAMANFYGKTSGAVTDEDISGFFVDKGTGKGRMFGYIPQSYADEGIDHIAITDETGHTVYVPISTGQSNQFFNTRIAVTGSADASKKVLVGDGYYNTEGNWVERDDADKQIGWASDNFLVDSYSNALFQPGHTYRIRFTEGESLSGHQHDMRLGSRDVFAGHGVAGDEYHTAHEDVHVMYNNGFDVYSGKYEIVTDDDGQTHVIVRRDNDE